MAPPAPSAGPTSPGGSRSATAAGPVKVVRRRRKAAAPEIPLGSLSQPQGVVPGPPTCPDCSSTSMTRLVVAQPVGVPAVFVSCHDCERSGWFAVDGGHEVSRESVVTEAATDPVTDTAADPVAEPSSTPET